MKKMNTGMISKMNKTLLVLVMISCCMISATMAKYVSAVSAADSARVAKFDVYSNLTEEKSLDLFGTLYNGDWSEETNVLSKEEDNVVAPGTRGSFDIMIDNRSEVSIAYDLLITCTNAKWIPIEFSLDGENWDNELLKVYKEKGDLLVQGDSTETLTIYWKWDFENKILGIPTARDTRDTILGKEGNAKVYVTIAGTFTQID